MRLKTHTAWVYTDYAYVKADEQQFVGFLALASIPPPAVRLWTTAGLAKASAAWPQRRLPPSRFSAKAGLT
ncbi:MAG TPA: hypothetical protein GXZ82_00130 [Firmicutes bacterium]|nr:hypothetical protein [Bacillota bacterium]